MTVITRKVKVIYILRVTRTVLTQARVILAIVHVPRTPVVRLRIISRKVKKKEKSP